ncbi:MAG: hypothetical protein A2Y07_09720 [Planctomycetes bacterium GWF2_50_10]|nr:MAG: hypothetical protein A2Y07_09720 [Planctomycetes bacterium GWF2_50_10]
MPALWAIAKNTIAQAVRMKVAAIFIVLLLILLPLMSVIVTGDGSVKGKLQTFVGYGLSLTSLLLCLLTIIISTYSLSSDIKYKQIWTVVTKPVRRWQVMLGKLLGIIILDFVLLAGFASIIYGLTMLMPRLSHAGPDEMVQLENEFFTARASVKPLIPDVRNEVEEAFSKMQDQGNLPQGMTPLQVRQQLYQQKMLEKQAVPPGQAIAWQFQDVAVFDPNQYIFIRFKYDVSVNPPNMSVYGRWIIGDDRQLAASGSSLKTPIYAPPPQSDSIRTVHELAVPADAVVDGYLGLAFQNLPANNTVVIFPTEDGLEVLYKAGSFQGNFIRAVAVIFIRLVFLAMLGVSLAAWLSFPVAILVCLVIFAMGSMSTFIFESFDALEGSGSVAYTLILKPALNLLPQFDKFAPADFLIKGQYLSLASVLGQAGVMIGIQGAIVLIVGIVIFRFKEMAKVTV